VCKTVEKLGVSADASGSITLHTTQSQTDGSTVRQATQVGLEPDRDPLPPAVLDVGLVVFIFLQVLDIGISVNLGGSSRERVCVEILGIGPWLRI
jgi:hypothetical protein